MLPEARGKGAYQALVDARLRYAAAQGIPLATSQAKADTSAPILERLGFRQEGLFRSYLDIDGAWRDHLGYALLAEEVPGGALARWQQRTGH